MKRCIATSMLIVGCSLPEDGLAPTADASPPPPDTSVGPDVSTTDVTEADAPISFDVIDAPIVTAGDALQFSGNSFVDMGGVPIPSDFTLEAWIDPASSNGETYVVAKDKRNQGAGQFRFGLTSGKLFFVMSDATGSTHGLFTGGYTLISSQSIATNAWTHVAVTKSGSAFALFVNGVVTKAVTADATFSYGGPATAFRVGARVDTNGSSANGGFDGAIDEVRLWTMARSPTEIGSTMKTTVSPSSAGLADEWRFDEGTGNATNDEVSNGYPGTLVGGPTWIVSTAF